VGARGREDGGGGAPPPPPLPPSPLGGVRHASSNTTLRAGR
jgi:hypothetical protein